MGPSQLLFSTLTETANLLTSERHAHFQSCIAIGYVKSRKYLQVAAKIIGANNDVFQGLLAVCHFLTYLKEISDNPQIITCCNILRDKTEKKVSFSEVA